MYQRRLFSSLTVCTDNEKSKLNRLYVFPKSPYHGTKKRKNFRGELGLNLSPLTHQATALTTKPKLL